MQSDLGKLFIGGISWETNEEGLTEYFSTYGDVVEAVIMKDRTTGRARGFGFVVFSDPNVAERVVMEKHNIDGRMVEAKRAVPRDDQTSLSRSSGSIHGSPGPGRTRKIFVGGLASTVTESDFRTYFEQFGIITDIVIMYDHNTKRPRGFGFVTYDSEEGADGVLLKTFHELNGKVVEVKRAVPKELSPGPSRSPLSGFNYGLSRASSIPNGYTQGYSPSGVRGYGFSMDGRFSPIASSRSGFPPFGSNHGIGMNLEVGLNPSYVGNANCSSNLSYGRSLNPYYIGNSNRFANPVGFDGGNEGSSSFFSSATRNLWGNGGINYGTNSSNINFEGSGDSLGGGNFRNSNNNWGTSPGQGVAISNSNPGNVGYGASDSSYSLGGGSYGRKNGSNAVPTSSAHTSSNAGYDGPFSDFYNSNSSSFYGDSTWRSSAPERDGSRSFSYAIGNTASDISTKVSAGIVGGYGFNKRQPPNRGIAA